CGRHSDDLCSGGAQLPEELREADVVADSESQAPHRCIDHHGLAPRRNVCGLAVRLRLTRNVDIEQMDLVVARDALAARIEDERSGGDTTVRRLDGHRAGHDPEPELTRSRSEKILNWTAAVGFSDRALVGVLQAHEWKILGKRSERCPLLARLRQ